MSDMQPPVAPFGYDELGQLVVPSEFDLNQYLIGAGGGLAPGQVPTQPFELIAYAQQNGFQPHIDFLERIGVEPGSAQWVAYLQSQGLTLPRYTPPGFGAGGPTTEQKIEGMMANMRAAALAWNVRIPDSQLRGLATAAVNGNYNNQQILNSIGRYAVGQDAGVTDVVQGELGKAVKSMAKQYGINVSDATTRELLNGYIQGTETQETVLTKFKQQAIAAHPALRDRFEAGETFEQIINPYREVAAQLLEKDPNEFDFTTSSLSKVASYNPDNKGERMMSIAEFSDMLRKDQTYGYQYTEQAKSKAYQVTNALASLFGRV